MSLPDRAAILAFIEQSKGTVGRREIARAFKLRGAEREQLKELLADMQEAGELEGGPGRSFHLAGSLPRVSVLTVTSVAAGRATAVPDKWEGESEPPVVTVPLASARGRLNLAIGDSILTRVEGTGARLSGRIIRRIGRKAAPLLGVVVDRDGLLFLKPVDKRVRGEWPIHHGTKVEPGELVRAELKGSGARTVAHVRDRMGGPMSSLNLSDIAIAAKGIPTEFSEEALVEAEQAAERWAEDSDPDRVDLTHIPFVTIDPTDARDHDDALWAEADGTGWRLMVAIADVSWFVRPGSELDKAAFERGNSVYFPDQVVPMLPEALSADACSLKAGTVKAALVAELHLSGAGVLERWQFQRARIRVAENLAYEAVQQMADEEDESALSREILNPLWGCWRALMTEHERRAPLALDLPEKQVMLDSEGGVAGIVERKRLDAHRIVEEMMIVANVAAAKALEKRKAPVMYRCHEEPNREKLLALRDYLGTMGLKFALGQVMTTEVFNRVLARAEGRDDLPEIAEAVLRAQTQAYYAPRSTGHFGLQLASYAHFTSPIRRYSDILVHRALVGSFGLGEGGLPDGAEKRLAAIGEHISLTERRAMEAERDTLDRYIARHLSQSVGQILRAKITGVQAFGFFATVEELGGDGLVPVSVLGEERFRFDEAGRYLEGVESGKRFSMGERLELRLEEADPVAGSLRFSLPGVEPSERGPNRERGRKTGKRPPLKRHSGPQPRVWQKRRG